jgi:osmotically-inducible protein OsmY
MQALNSRKTEMVQQNKGENNMSKLNRIMRLVVSFALITAFMGCAATQKHESTGQYLDDSVITTKVKAAIFNEETLKTLQINVKTYQAVVQLSGFVDSTQSITKAGEVARHVESVLSVNNDLIVK